MDVPWKLASLKTFTSAEKPSPLFVAEFGVITDGLFETARRVYMVRNDGRKRESRGGHRHPAGGKLEFLICVAGKMSVRLHYPKACGRVRLSRPDQALVIASDVWHEVTLEPGAMLLSVATTNFDPAESRADKLCGCP